MTSPFSKWNKSQKINFSNLNVNPIVNLYHSKKNKQICSSFRFPRHMLSSKNIFIVSYSFITTTNNSIRKQKKNYKLSANSLPHGIIIFFPFIYISYDSVYDYYTKAPLRAYPLFSPTTFCHIHTKNALCSIIIFHEIIAEHKNLWVCLWHISNLTFSLCTDEIKVWIFEFLYDKSLLCIF